MILAGMSAKPIDNTKTIKAPLMLTASSFSFYETGNGEFIIVNLNSGFPVACFNIASYINYG